MPVLVDRGPGGCRIVAAGKNAAAQRLQARRHPSGGEWIEIGLVNNMPEAALEATEQQFVELLGAAAGDSWVRLRFFSLAGVPRSERARRYLSQSYCDVGDIRKAGLDGLIVTGAEPKAANLADEPYWLAFRSWSTGPRAIPYPPFGPASPPMRRSCISTASSACRCARNASGCSIAIRSAIIRSPRACRRGRRFRMRAGMR
jgi:hypothetical protein